MGRVHRPRRWPGRGRGPAAEQGPALGPTCARPVRPRPASAPRRPDKGCRRSARGPAAPPRGSAAQRRGHRRAGARHAAAGRDDALDRHGQVLARLRHRPDAWRRMRQQRAEEFRHQPCCPSCRRSGAAGRSRPDAARCAASAWPPPGIVAAIEPQLPARRAAPAASRPCSRCSRRRPFGAATPAAIAASRQPGRVPGAQRGDGDAGIVGLMRARAAPGGGRSSAPAASA